MFKDWHWPFCLGLIWLSEVLSLPMECRIFIFFYFGEESHWNFLMGTAALVCSLTDVQLYFHRTVVFTVSMRPVQGQVCMLPSSVSFFDVLITSVFFVCFLNLCLCGFWGSLNEMDFQILFPQHACYWHIENLLIFQYWFCTSYFTDSNRSKNFW